MSKADKEPERFYIKDLANFGLWLHCFSRKNKPYFCSSLELRKYYTERWEAEMVCKLLNKGSKRSCIVI